MQDYLLLSFSEMFAFYSERLLAIFDSIMIIEFVLVKEFFGKKSIT